MTQECDYSQLNPNMIYALHNHELGSEDETWILNIVGLSDGSYIQSYTNITDIKNKEKQCPNFFGTSLFLMSEFLDIPNILKNMSGCSQIFIGRSKPLFESANDLNAQNINIFFGPPKMD